jgi:glutathione S-transferase
VVKQLSEILQTITALPVLYSFRRCPYAIRARLGIYFSQLPVAIREVSLKQKPSTMLQCSPKGTVPVLVLADGQVIDESLDILRWALDRSDPNNLASGLSDQQWVLAMQLIEQNDGNFKYYLDRYKYADRYPQQTAQYYRQQAEVFLQSLEQRLSQSVYLLGDSLSLADIAILPFIRQFSMVDVEWFNSSPYPQLQHWRQQCLDAVWFKACMMKFQLWHSGDSVSLFPTQ